jgi:transcriptional regulator with XRE-family HTH domain
MSPLLRLPLRPGQLTGQLADLVRTARTQIGWTQDELADRAFTSQTTIWRMEHAASGALDLEMLDRVLAQLGLKVVLEVEGRHLVARTEQRDLVHAALLGVIAARLRRTGWEVATEVPTGASTPTGWIDLLAFRRVDSALVLGEIKTALPDIGGLQRQIAFYQREAPWAARRLGWLPESVTTVVACLDTADVATSLAANRLVLAPAFPGDPRVLESWLQGPAAPRPGGPTLCAIDLAQRRRRLDLRRTALGGRRTQPSYAGYAEAAARLEGPSVGARRAAGLVSRP